MITFTKDNETTKIEMVLIDDGLTWMELADEFVSFLQACGYIVKGYDVGDHLCTQYAFQKEEEKEEVLVLEHEYKSKKKREKKMPKGKMEKVMAKYKKVRAD